MSVKFAAPTLRAMMASSEPIEALPLLSEGQISARARRGCTGYLIDASNALDRPGARRGQTQADLYKLTQEESSLSSWINHANIYNATVEEYQQKFARLALVSKAIPVARNAFQRAELDDDGARGEFSRTFRDYADFVRRYNTERMTADEADGLLQTIKRYVSDPA